MNQPLIGHNIHTSHGFVSSADYAKKIGSSVYQIFLGSPQTYKPVRHSKKELDELKEKLVENNLKIVVHANYMLNFCNPVDSFKHRAAINLLVNDLEDSVRLNSLGVIIHMGKKLDLTEEVAINNYVLGVRNALKRSPKESTVILETGAGVGTEICTDIIKLGELYRRFNKEERKRIKFCIDTCHVYSAGYDLGCPNYVDLFCELVETHLGWKNIICVHLNDSKCCLGSRKDRHQDITKGFVSSVGLKKFVRICCNKKIPMILETPCGELSKTEQIKLVKKWCG